jgi:CHAD domain-containing protein
MARAELDRRSERARLRRERRFGLHANERLAEGLKRMALGQLDLAIEQVECAGGRVPAAVAVHEARKALKRLRTLLYLLRDELGERAFARETDLVREAGRRLAGARDAEVLVRTVDDLVARYPADLAHLGDLARLRAALVAEREHAAAMTLDGVTQAQALLYLREVRIRVCGWSLADRGGITAIERPLRRLYRQGRRRMKRARRGSRSRSKALHEWRKRVKDLRYAAEVLERPQRSKRRAAAGGSSRSQSAKAREGAAQIRALARRADSLGELLGEEHDLTMLAARVSANAQDADGAAARAGGTQMSAPGRKTRRTILKLIKRRRVRLRKRALRQGKRVYRQSPKRFMAGVRRAYSRAERVS